MAVSPGPREAGFVESFEGPAAGYSIQRAGESLPVAVFAALYSGDVVRVEDGGVEIQLRIGENTPVVLSQGDEPLRIGEAGEGATVQGNMVRWLGGWLAGDSGDAKAAGVSLVTRSAGLDAPLLGPPDPKLVAGTRSLHVAWQGGRAPFRVELRSGLGVDRVAVAEALEARSAVLPDLELLPGPYELEIADADGARIAGALTVVGEGPAAPDLGSLEADGPLGRTVHAAWLASLTEGEWTLEGYQRIATIEGAYRPADLLREALAARRRPPSPD